MSFKGLLRGAAGWLGDILAIGGAACVIFGVCRIYLPAGLIVLGLFLIGGAIIIARAEEEAK